MDERALADLLRYLPMLYRRHPWHGITCGEDAPRKLIAYIEIVTTDTVKYELDKRTGYLKVDRPQQFSNVYPSLYGLIPQTYCGERIGALCSERANRPGIKGDGDPLDICVLSERDITHGDILVPAIPIGGLRMIDGNEADDKIISVLEGDAVYGKITEIEHLPSALVDRLEHYFLTYKQAPGTDRAKVEITHIYGRHEAYEVIRKSQEDYEATFGEIKRTKEILATTQGRS
jgi:inorganic pyrophosphatase